MTVHLTGNRGGFGPGFTPITRFDEPEDDTGIAFGVLRLNAGESRVVETACETAWLLMSGKVTLAADNAAPAEAERGSLFDDGPWCLHASAGTRVTLTAHAASELTVYETRNTARFPARIYSPKDVPDERRGAGQVGDACLRLVRTIFDIRNADPAARLVLGEVVTLPGRWSSYPPHHHPQPEIYHYRFDRSQGYGHAELGEAVMKVRHGDTIKIFDGLDHAQTSAPGYAMYYAWVIRHLPERPYTVPEFTAEHAWTMDRDATIWHAPEA